MSTVALIAMIVGFGLMMLAGFLSFGPPRRSFRDSAAPDVTLVVGFVMVLVSAITFIFTYEKPDTYKAIQQRVNQCLESGGHPIITQSANADGTHTRYWGCER